MKTPTGVREDRNYTPEQLRQMLDEMEKLSNAFYGAAFKIGNHAFIEFTGLMNEYITMCRYALGKDSDFTTANVHSGKPLVPKMEVHHARYLGEKFGCIFATTFDGNPELLNAFMQSAFGVNAVVKPPKRAKKAARA